MMLSKPAFTFGREELCDLHVDNEFAARLQARLERERTYARQSLRVTDISSGRNDLVFEKVACKEFCMGAGDGFDINKVHYFAMTEQMQEARSELAEVLGMGQYKVIDDFIISAVKDPLHHVLLLGEPGCDQTRLAQMIHFISHRRQRPFLALPKEPQLDSALRQALLNAASGTVLVPLFQRGALEKDLVDEVLTPQLDLRLVICASTPGKIPASFPPEALQKAHVVRLPPLRERTTELPPLLDTMFVARRSALRFAHLRPELRQGLMEYDWPANLHELRKNADRFVLLAPFESRQQAIEHSGLSDGSLRRWAKRLNLLLKFPIAIKS